ncbi:MAG: HNH endonuclease [Rhizobiales bacterium]|nr:HNH endonuclease [Hyphomicrobiales bacterium]
MAAVVNFYIANTDHEWFDFLANKSDLIEVNFWQPSAKGFHAIGAGELFVFRLKSPRNKIGGFGILSNSTILPLQLAWETFGELNGTPNYEAFRLAIQKYRRDEKVGLTTNIGCRVLVEPVFLPEHRWLDLPSSWSLNVMGGKRYGTEDAEAYQLWERLLGVGSTLAASAPFGFYEQTARYGEPTLITPRLGQRAFRIAVTESYGRQCCVTDGKVLPALDAAHIKPYSDGGLHAKPNGILLRRDIHSIFDAGFVTVDPEYRFVVSRKVKEVFNNGEEYRRLHGKRIRLPGEQNDWPDRDLLRWHNTERFTD